MLNRITQAADVTNPNSLSNRMRAARFERFKGLLDSVNPDPTEPIHILDLGGTPNYWEQMDVADDPRFDITTINIYKPKKPHPTIKQLQGDATAVEFEDNSFDVVFSNSVIEHVGDRRKQAAMAREVGRLAASYYVQTPAKYFPIEPHFHSPLCYPLIPDEIRARELKRTRGISLQDAREHIGSVSLLRLPEFRMLFPDAQIIVERFYGLAKSWTAIRQPNSTQ
ncbi:MAG: methyltransferase domain-containing protein [Candidatus Saccharimonadales bacterium]